MKRDLIVKNKITREFDYARWNTWVSGRIDSQSLAYLDYLKEMSGVEIPNDKEVTWDFLEDLKDNVYKKAEEEVIFFYRLLYRTFSKGGTIGVALAKEGRTKYFYGNILFAHGDKIFSSQDVQSFRYVEDGYVDRGYKDGKRLFNGYVYLRAFDLEDFIHRHIYLPIRKIEKKAIKKDSIKYFGKL